MALPMGWKSDLAVLGSTGAVIEDCGDHLVVRSPQNPLFHWGHFVLATDPDAGGDPARWLNRFAEAFPGASHRAIGFVGDLDETATARWVEAGLDVRRDPVLASDLPLQGRRLAGGYAVRQFTDESDWASSTTLRDQCYPGDPDFALATTRARVRSGCTWFGAFAETGALAAELGIMNCGGGAARYQGVLTHPEHRRRGLTSHLLVVADHYARQRLRTTTTVIIADQGSRAADLYRHLGFRDLGPKVQAYRFG